MFKSAYGVMYRKVDEGIFECHYEGVIAKLILFNPKGLKEGLRYISESDPWQLWNDRNIIEEDFAIEVLN